MHEPLDICAFADGPPPWLRSVPLPPGTAAPTWFAAFVARGLARAVAGFAEPPWSLGTSDARAGDNYALRVACARGHTDIVRQLGAPDGPWQLNADDARAGNNFALRVACERGFADIVRQLGDPEGPWRLTADDARAGHTDALHTAISNGHTDIVRQLRDPHGPWRLGPDEALRRADG